MLLKVVGTLRVPSTTNELRSLGDKNSTHLRSKYLRDIFDVSCYTLLTRH